MSSANDVDAAASVLGATEVEGTTANGIDEYIPSLEENPEESIDEDPNFIPRTEIPEDVYAGHSESEIAAVSVIQKIYRIIMARRHRLDKPGLEGGVHRYFKEYLCTLQPSMAQGFPSLQTVVSWAASPYFGFSGCHSRAGLDQKGQVRENAVE